LIQQIKRRCAQTTHGTRLGIGDDAAVLLPDPTQQLVVSTDTLVAGVHFKATDPPATIGHKSLAVNFSDLAAMGAQPKWVLLNLTLPTIEASWLDPFIQGFAQLLGQFDAQLVGGDTTQGPLSIGVTVLGQATHAITRAGAQIGDCVVVSGELGSAAYALHNPGHDPVCDQQLQQPKPRFDTAEAVRDLATAMIDVSDGLLQDLGHICQASGVSAEIELSHIPHRPSIKQDANWINHMLNGGDDYQLCFTINPQDQAQLPVDCAVIGQITAPQANPVRVLKQQQPMALAASGYQHFSETP